MSRQRFIYPETFASDDFVALSLGARLLFIGMFTTADDYGRGKGSLGALKATIYPADELSRGTIGTWAEEIRKRKMVRFYEVDGSIYYEVAKWEKWQRPKYKVASKIPPFQEKSKLRGRLVPDPGTNQPGDRDKLGNGLGSVVLGREGEGGVGLGGSAGSEGGEVDASDPLAVPDPDPDPEENREPTPLENAIGREELDEGFRSMRQALRPKQTEGAA
jgi:hypothetical protein